MGLPTRICLTLLPFLFALTAHAQATYTATRDWSFAAFLAGGETSTGRASTNPNLTFGLDATRHFRLFNPSLELRVGMAPGRSVSERTYQVGIKVERQIGRIHPYADFLIGEGTINYNATHTSDNSKVPSLGAGVDFDLNNHWSLKADFQHQSWKLGAVTPTFNPDTFSVGIQYRFHFGK